MLKGSYISRRIARGRRFLDSKVITCLLPSELQTERVLITDELEALEDLHMFRATKVNSGIFEYVYASQFRVSIPCKNFVPIISRVDVITVDKARGKHKDEFPRLSKIFLDMAKQQIVRGKNLTTRQVGPVSIDSRQPC
jgi:hypothetical protein